MQVINNYLSLSDISYLLHHFRTDYMPIYPSRGSYTKSLDEIVDVKVRLHQTSWANGVFKRAVNWHLVSVKKETV